MLHFSQLHPGFKLNGRAYTYQSLIEFAVVLAERENYEKAIGLFLLEWLSKDSTVLVHTSGSTGAPKPIVLKKEHMVNSAMATASFFELKQGDTALLCLPANYIAGKMMLVRALVLGLNLDYVDPSSTPLEKTTCNYNFCAMIPLQVHASLSKLNQVKKLIIGGAAVSSDLKSKLLNIGTRVYETYGMTETITHIAVQEINAPMSSFKALPNITLSVDTRNCLVIYAPKISTQFITTNDVVTLVSETEFKWLGRYDTIINSGGIKLNPEQIEAKLSDFIQDPFFVSSLPDPILENKLILVIEGSKPKEELHSKLKNASVFSTYEVPKEIYFLPEFVRTDTGKINRYKTVALLKL
ncbi:AMP-binding protein [Cellulophaga sp. F20128]|uniref:AMP-binding protein n=1 Tax=Cellulophaga sp. F20128 TaxID=2926413 RepID=UPI001FF36F3A|nr:AMP-binding protein [Cellulophaga sp. F20128]MCK0156642.1 AMP-binding protein [Cellulophaga sp. F20128]